MFSTIRLLVFSFCILLLANTTISCTSAKQLAYFQDLPDKNVVDLPPFQPEERIIENGDEVNIYFSAKDNEAANYFNKASSTPSVTAPVGAVPALSNTAGYNYTVATDGYIEIPNLGLMKIAGLTVPQLRAKLLADVAPYLKSPMVDIKFNTFKISVIGDVRSPGRYTLDMQRTTLLDALAAAGDLPATAERTDIQLYRDYNGQRKIYKIDLTKSSILNDQTLFQLRHNDILYVRPLKTVYARENFNTITASLSILISFITLGFALLRK